MPTTAFAAASPATDARRRLAGILIAAASVLAVLMMAQHPTTASSNMAEVAAEIAREAHLDHFVHGALMTLLCVLLFGFTEFSAHLGLHRPIVRAALFAYAIGVAAPIGAVLINGFIATDLGIHYVGADADALEIFRHQLYLCLRGNQALANLGLVARSVAVVLWSCAILRDGRNRVLGLSGLLLDGAPAIALLLGVLRLDAHGAMLGVLCGAVWNVALATQLLRAKL